jgi:hypothetical protein
MSREVAFQSRLAELRRRVEALPGEVAGWVDRAADEIDFNAHDSQVRTLARFMGGLFDRQRQQVDGLDPKHAAFPDQAHPVVAEINRVQGVWDFFRDMLSLRFSPDFKEPLWIADTVAWNCHFPVLEAAALRGIVKLDQVREPPLTYISAEFSPATWVRGSRPRDTVAFHLGPMKLPIPVIEIPADHLVSSWELLSIPHEVGHDLEQDLGIDQALTGALEAALHAAPGPIPPERVDAWMRWKGEVFADLIALQLAGPAFAESLMALIMLPAAWVLGWNAGDVHPNHFVRILTCAAYAKTLAPPKAGEPAAAAQVRAQIAADADALVLVWKEIYPGAPARLTAFAEDFDVVFGALMDAPLAELQGATVRSLVPYEAADDARIRHAAEYLRTGLNTPVKGTVKPRHCVSASRLAVTAAGAAGGDLAVALASIDERTTQLVRDNTPSVLRGSDSSAHDAFIQSFVEGFR